MAEVGDEVLMVLRVAERPRAPRPDIVCVPIWDARERKLATRTFPRYDPHYDFSDPRAVVHVGQTRRVIGLTYISYLRLARSRDGIHSPSIPLPSCSLSPSWSPTALRIRV